MDTENTERIAKTKIVEILERRKINHWRSKRRKLNNIRGDSVYFPCEHENGSRRIA